VASHIRENFISQRNLHMRILRESNMLEVSSSDTLHPRWDGGVDSRNVRHKPVWPKLAAKAVADNLNPSNWVSCLFRLAWIFDRVPTPNDLLNPEVLKKMACWAEDSRLDVYFLVRTELLNLAKEQWFREQNSTTDKVSISRMIVLDPSLDTSPLVRYVKAARDGQGDLAERLEPYALSQFMTSRDAYVEALGKRLPKRLITLAAETQLRINNG
jgi:hypothetical protein